MNRWTLVLALVLCACGPSELPLPSVVSVSPESMASSESILLNVELDGVLPVTVDYDTGSAELHTTVFLSIGEQRLEVVQMEDKGKRLVVQIPPGLPMGSQDLRIEFEDGRQVVLPQRFEVRPPLDITALAINPIATQVRNRPFSFTIRAVGPDAELFQGIVKLSISRGTISPALSGAFERGIRIQEATVDDTGGNLTITAEDYAGHSAASNDFRLNPN